MRANQSLWLVTATLPSPQAERFENAFQDALALSTLSPPRQKYAELQAIYDHQPDDVLLTAQLSVLAAIHGVEVPDFTIKPAPRLDWLKKVASDFPPLKIGRCTVHGALHRDKVVNRLHALQIDATNAFGTGEHPTTRGCLMMLDRILKSGFRPRRMVDIGCGSGILAMACVKAARGRAVAVDLDPSSVQIASGNARINGLAQNIRIARSRGYATPLVRRHAPYDLVMANIFATPLAHMAKDLRKYLRPGGIAILSGLLTSQANRVISAHRLQHLRLIEHKKIGEWSVLVLQK